MTDQLAVRGGPPALAVPLRYEWPVVDADAEAAVVQQLHKGLSIYDRSGVVAQFEDDFSRLHQRKYGLVTSSGTAALHSAYYALGLGPGDEVICPTYTFFATATPLFQLGALPVLADCDAEGNLEAGEIGRLVTNRTKAVAVTHMWGLPCNMDAVASACRKHGLALVEDCSHAHGASYAGRLVGTFGQAAAWSLQTKKIIAAGEGGVLLTDSQELYDRAQLLGHFNKRAMQEISADKPYYPYAVTGLGLKYRAHPLGIALAVTQLPKLGAWIRAKQANAARVRAALANVGGLVPVHRDVPDRTNAYYAFLMETDPRDSRFSKETFVSACHAENFVDVDIPASTAPLHTFAAFQRPVSPVTAYDRPCVRGPYPNAEAFAARAIKISIPVENTPGSRGAEFIDGFAKVLRKVARNLA